MFKCFFFSNLPVSDPKLSPPSEHLKCAPLQLECEFRGAPKSIRWLQCFMLLIHTVMNRMIEQQLKSNKIKWILVSSISFFFFFCNSFSRHYRAPLLFMSAFQYNKLLHGISMYRSNKGFIRQFHCVIFLLLCVVVNFPHTNCINERLPGRSIRYCSVSARTLFGNFARAKTSPIGCG